MDFVDGALSVGRVMQHSIRINNIETRVTEWQAFAIGDGKLAILAVEDEMLPRGLDRTRCQIDAGDFRAAARELQKVRAHAAADFEQVLAGEIIEPHDFGHPRRIFLITVTLNLVKELAGAELMRAAIDGPGRIVGPLLTRALLVGRLHG